MHLISEAERLAYADRAQYVADSDFVPVPVKGLVDPTYLASRAALIGERSMGTATPGTPPGIQVAYAPDRSPLRISTSQVVAVDDQGGAVSMTTTVESAFGSHLMVQGFLLNNQMTDFSFIPEENGRKVANRVEPGKRPRSSMAPTLIFDRQTGEFLATLGSQAARRSSSTSPSRPSACSTGTSTRRPPSICPTSAAVTARRNWNGGSSVHS